MKAITVLASLALVGLFVHQPTYVSAFFYKKCAYQDAEIISVGISSCPGQSVKPCEVLLSQNVTYTATFIPAREITEPSVRFDIEDIYHENDFASYYGSMTNPTPAGKEVTVSWMPGPPTRAAQEFIGTSARNMRFSVREWQTGDYHFCIEFPAAIIVDSFQSSQPAVDQAQTPDVASTSYGSRTNA